jgi:branched-chain amino acid aminotransferase
VRAWLNGVAVEGAIPIDPSDRGLLLGDGIFETILVRDHRPVWLDAHLERMAAAARELGIAFPRSLLESSLALHEEAARPLQAGKMSLAVLRITLTRGPGHRGLAGEAGPPTLLVTRTPFDAGLQFQPVRLITAATRRNENSAAPRLKTLSCVDNILAAREAAAQGADEALMLNCQGRAACATIGNLFAVTKNGIVTPPIADGALPGIARRTLLDRGLAREAPLAPQDLREAAALFLTNSLRLVRPVSSFDGKAFASGGHRGVVLAFEALKAAFET